MGPFSLHGAWSVEPVAARPSAHRGGTSEHRHKLRVQSRRASGEGQPADLAGVCTRWSPVGVQCGRQPWDRAAGGRAVSGGRLEKGVRPAVGVLPPHSDLR